MARSVGHVALAATAYAMLALAIFRPTVDSLTRTVPAFERITADAALLMWATSHVSTTLPTSPRHVFDGRILHPAPRTLAMSDHMIGQALLGWPIWAATGNPILEFNLLSLGSYVAGATAVWALAVYGCGLSALPAWTAGLVFAFTPYRYHSPQWLQVLWTAFVPLALLAWLHFVRAPTLRPWLAWVACWFVHMLMGMYMALYFAVLMGALAVVTWCATRAGRHHRVVLGSLGAAGAVAVAFLPVAWPYAAVRLANGTARHGGLDTPWSFFLPGPGTIIGALLHPEPGLWFGPGIVAVVLAAVGCARLGRRGGGPLPTGDVLVRILVLSGFLVTFLLVVTPLRWQQAVPGFDMIRATNRAFYLTLLFLGLAAAIAVEWIASGTPWIAALLAALVVIDGGTPPPERQRLPLADELSPGVRAMRALPDDAIVYEHANDPQGLARAMYHAIFHRKRLASGYTGFLTPGAEYTTAVLYRFPDAASLRLMSRLGIGWVLARFPDTAAADAVVDAVTRAGGAVATHTPQEILFDVRGVSPSMPLPATNVLPKGSWSVSVPVGSPDPTPLRDDHVDAESPWRAGHDRSASPALTITLADGAAPITGLAVRLTRDHAGWLYGATIDVSSDGTQWTRVESIVEPVPFDAFLRTPPPIVTIELRFSATQARAIRLTNPSFGEWTGILDAQPQLRAIIAQTNPSGGYWAGSWEIVELDVLALRNPERDAS